MIRFIKSVAVIVSLATFSIALANGDDGASCKQIDEVLSELREIGKILNARTIAPSASGVVEATVNLEGVPFIGSQDAPTTVVEFTDYQCPFCRRFYATTFRELKLKYVDTGNVRFYSMDFPLDVHPNAMLAAEAAQCASAQGKFWAMHDMMRATEAALDRDSLMGYARDISLDTKVFQQCIDSGTFKSAIDRSISAANGLNVHGTPTFIIGRSTAVGLDKGSIVVGAVGLDAFRAKDRDAFEMSHPKLLDIISPDKVQKAAPNCGKFFAEVLAHLK